MASTAGLSLTPLEEPLDLTNPLDLSLKHTANLDDYSLTATASNVYFAQRAATASDKSTSKFPTHGSTAYPVNQRRQNPAATYEEKNGTCHQIYDQNRNTSSRTAPNIPLDTCLEEGDCALRCLFRNETAHIDNMRAQATQAAHAAASKAMARHAARLNQTRRNDNQQPFQVTSFKTFPQHTTQQVSFECSSYQNNVACSSQSRQIGKEYTNQYSRNPSTAMIHNDWQMLAEYNCQVDTTVRTSTQEKMALPGTLTKKLLRQHVQDKSHTGGQTTSAHSVGNHMNNNYIHNQATGSLGSMIEEVERHILRRKNMIKDIRAWLEKDEQPQVDDIVSNVHVDHVRKEDVASDSQLQKGVLHHHPDLNHLSSSDRNVDRSAQYPPRGNHNMSSHHVMSQQNLLGQQMLPHVQLTEQNGLSPDGNGHTHPASLLQRTQLHQDPIHHQPNVPRKSGIAQQMPPSSRQGRPKARSRKRSPRLKRFPVDEDDPSGLFKFAEMQGIDVLYRTKHSKMFVKKCNDQPVHNVAAERQNSRLAPDSDMNLRRKECSLVDLTGDSATQQQSSNMQNGFQRVESTGTLPTLLPSCNDFTTSQREETHCVKMVKGKLDQEEMASVAKRLLSSSQEFLKQQLAPQNGHIDESTTGVEEHSYDLHRKSNQRKTALTKNSLNVSMETSLHDKTDVTGPPTMDKISLAAAESSPPGMLAVAEGVGDSGSTSSEETRPHEHPIIISHETPPEEQAIVREPDVIDRSENLLGDVKDLCLEEQPQDSVDNSINIHQQKCNKNEQIQADKGRVGEKMHFFKRAVIRLNDLGKKLTNGGYREIVSVDNVLTKPCSEIKGKKRKRRRVDMATQRIRHRHSKGSSRTSRPRIGQKRGQNRFKDFVPTILGTRTRHAGSGCVPMYDSIHNFVFEGAEQPLPPGCLREHQDYLYFDTPSETEAEVDSYNDEDYLPSKEKRKRSRSNIREVDRNGNTSKKDKRRHSSSDRASATNYPSDDDVFVDSPQLRVELGENSAKHIKLKFVNIRSISMETTDAEERPSRPQSHKRRRSGEGNRNEMSTKSKKFKPSSSHVKVKTDNGAQCPEEQDGRIDQHRPESTSDPTSCKMTSPGITEARAFAHAPKDMDKLKVNKKLGETFLHRAAKLGNMEIVSYLVESLVVPVNAQDNAGYTALHDCCVPGHVTVARYLIQHGADVNAATKDGTRPIHDAVDNNSVDMVRLLLANGADPFHLARTGHTATILALERSSEMKALMLGYLNDVLGAKKKDEGTPENQIDYKWNYSDSCSGSSERKATSDADNFADDMLVRNADLTHVECVEEDEGIFLEISEKATPSSCHVKVESDYEDNCEDP